jgi:hypothetical protein
VASFDSGVFCMTALGSDFLFCGMRSGLIARFHATGSGPLHLARPAHMVSCTSLAVDGRVLAAGFDNGWVQLFWADGDLVPFQTLRLKQRSMVRAIDVSVERNCLVLGTYDGRVIVRPLFFSLAQRCAAVLPEKELANLPDHIREACMRIRSLEEMFPTIGS